MPRTETITCDNCTQDLTSAPGMEYRLCLTMQRLPYSSDTVYDYHRYPIMPGGPYYFCSLGCLDKWRVETGPGMEAEMKFDRG